MIFIYNLLSKTHLIIFKQLFETSYSHIQKHRLLYRWPLLYLFEIFILIIEQLIPCYNSTQSSLP